MTASKQEQTCLEAIGLGEGRSKAIGLVTHCRLTNYPQIKWLKATNMISRFWGAESWVPLAQISPGAGIKVLAMAAVSTEGSLGKGSFLISPKWLSAGFGFS